MKRLIVGMVIAITLILACTSSQASMRFTVKQKSTATPGVTFTPKGPTATPTLTPTDTETPTSTATTVATEVPTATQGALTEPYPDAPACPDVGVNHDNSVFHTLWDSTSGCHYDHEHGQDPFTPEVDNAFAPLGSLYGLLGNRGVGNPNPSSPVEPTDKHSGYKFNVEFLDCAPGFESATYGLDAAVIEIHSFGDTAIELEPRFHSSAIMARQCEPDSEEKGFMFISILQDIGQRLFSYQGVLMLFPNTPDEHYPTGLGPYWAAHCIFCGAKVDTREAILAAKGAVPETVTSKGGRVAQQSLANILYRGRDGMAVVDARDTTHPFTYSYLCSANGGVSYSPIGCEYTNSTTRVHELQIHIPEEWDNLSDWDTDPRDGFIDVDGYVDLQGRPTACFMPHVDCYVIKLVDWKPGHTGATFQVDKTQQFTRVGLPSRNVWFCENTPCQEGDFGARPSGWIGPNN